MPASYSKIVILLLGMLVMLMNPLNSAENTNISHGQEIPLQEAIERIRDKIKMRGDLSYISVKEQLELVQQLSEFGLGKFLLQHGGLNGFWINYVVNHPTKGRLTGLNSENQPFSPLETFLLDQAPSALATQERFTIFKEQIQKRLHNGIRLAAIPCGLMTELLDLDYVNIDNFSLFGIDIDTDCLEQSRQIASTCNLSQHCEFIQKDAWNLGIHEQFDGISSNGLTIYEPDDQRVVELYRQFYLALKPNGFLITSFWTPPPIPGTKTEWNLEAVNSQHALLQKILISDIMESHWNIFRTEENVRSQLTEAGFSQIEVIYDRAHIFPTIIAKKIP